MEIFVLTLPDAKDRQTSIEKQMNRFHVKFRFFYGVYGKDLSNEEIHTIFNNNKSMSKIGYEMSKNEIACAYGHYLIYSAIVKEKITDAIIIEDDAILNEDFIRIVRILEQKAIKKSVLIKLEKEKNFKSNFWRKIPLDDNYTLFRPIQGVYLTTVYYLNLNAAKRLVKDAYPIFVPSDFFAYTCKHVELLNINKSLAFQDSNQPSLIGNRNKRKKNKDNLAQILARKAVRFIRFINPL